MQISELLNKEGVDLSPLAEILKDKKSREKKKRDFEEVFKKFVREFKDNPIEYVTSNPARALNFAVAVSGYSITQRMNISQIRKILELMRSIKRKYERRAESEEITRDIYRVRFMLAYNAGRHRSMKPLVDVLEPMLVRVRDAGDFNAVYEFFQSVVAFHYFLGGSK